AEIIFNNMQNDAEFDFFIQSMWKYQWLQTPTGYDNDFKEVIYEETQGISDLIVKLFVYSQQEAIHTGREKLSIQLIKKVARDKFKLLQPMLDAIRSGNPHKIAKYEDIRLLEPAIKPTSKRVRKSNTVVKHTTSKPQKVSKEKVVPKINHKPTREDDLRYMIKLSKDKKP